MSTSPVPSHPPTDDDQLQMAIDYTWNWFALHSQQRMQFVNFLVLALTLTTAAYAAAISQSRFEVGAAIGVSGLVLVVVFWRLDQRTRELVQQCEPVLEAIEARLNVRTELPIDFVRAVRTPANRFGTYRVTLRALSWFAGLMYLAGTTYALLKWA